MSDATQDAGQTQNTPADPSATATPSTTAQAASPSQAPDPAKAAEPAKPVIPEKYEFKPPEGVEFDAEQLNEYAPIFKEAGLTQDAAQKLLETHLTIQQAAFQKQLTTWEGDLKKDTEFGGKNFDENVKAAQAAVARFLTPEDKAFLDRTGLGSYPGLVKAFHRIGKAISEDAVPPPNKEPANKGPKAIYNHPTSAQLNA